MNIKKLIIFVFIILINGNAYSLPTYLNPNTWKELPPSEANVNIYDELLLNTVPRFWRNISPSGMNLGTKIEFEVLIWEGKDFCAYVSYDRVFDPDWAYDSSYMLGLKLKNLWKQSNNSPTRPYYYEKCALYDTDADYSGKKKTQFNEKIGRIDKKKGIKGSYRAVRTQTFEYLDPKFECLLFAGGLGESGWVGYDAALTLSAIDAYICVEDKSYFTKSRIKNIARSLGIDDIDGVSLKLKSPPPDDLRLDLSQFDTITGKRDDYSILKAKKIVEKLDNQNSEINISDDLSLEDKLKRLKKLFDQKLITQEDYDIKRQELLDQF